MKRIFLTFILAIAFTHYSFAADLLVEAESFTNKGGWVLDQQFSDLMGSDYIMAHGMGHPVADASTQIVMPKSGTYYVYVRTFNWTSPWYKGEGVGCFMVSVDGTKLKNKLGVKGDKWEWQYAGSVFINGATTSLSLSDLTGFNGRCDAIYFTTNKRQMPPVQRQQQKVENAGEFDFVVAGAGVAGMCAAVTAARLGLKVALINDRPVLGGNNSSEIRVHLGGHIELEPYPQLGNMVKEFGATRVGNAKPKEYYEDQKKQAFVDAESNITLFANYRVFGVKKKGNKISAITARNTESGEVLSFLAPVFSDCTGDGTLGFLAGADYVMGREAKSEFNESTAPELGDKMTMGSSVQWYSEDKETDVRFPVFKYGIEFNVNNAEKVTMGEWTWETGMNRDQIKDFEYIRDYGLMVIYSNWSYLKNEMADNDKFATRQLGWVAYVSGKRESRRLLGDHILSENDLRNFVEYPDGSAPTSWSIDLHYPDPKNSKNFPGNEFKSIAKHIAIHPYPIPYRCFYSRNIDNLFMAGRNISVTHVALGTVRVMRTTAMMGEVVGMAASLCNEYGTTPRGVYELYLPQLVDLMKEGAGKKGLPNNQKYNQGATLGKRIK